MLKLTEAQAAIIAQILNTYDHNAQASIATEELAKLIQAISKKLRAVTPPEHVLATQKIIDEMADVYIMLAQLRLIFHVNDDSLSERVDFKLERQLRRMELQNNA